MWVKNDTPLNFGLMVVNNVGISKILAAFAAQIAAALIRTLSPEAILLNIVG